VRSQAERDRVRELVAAGLNDCQIARVTGIPRGTVRDWRRGKLRRRRAETLCAVCAGTPDRLPAASYAHLLGAYLGDGSIVHTRRGVYRLRVACDLLHINIAVWIALAIEDVRGRRAALQPRTTSSVIDVSSYWKHWPCVFPQHGPGRKHARRIALADWQQRIVHAHPGQLVRGLIHSDGSRHINRIRHPHKTYEYTRYEFSNRSEDIKRIFCDACDALGVEWRVMNRDAISIARRPSVAKLDAFIGPKR
jgi:transcriptional regulator with XRE-family HTH domain